ncbi:hypothetical protein QJS10_CPB22g00133 [Acorus calamus]|uniref:Uncharacterized protein n=1 Tax=Acorus calamus TaxID=4465 RepID=A0AAV9BZM2_ACOCL|nr:hypothetical protein QJS10_CPB22g00133 [Acorus calamus]
MRDDSGIVDAESDPREGGVGDEEEGVEKPYEEEKPRRGGGGGSGGRDGRGCARGPQPLPFPSPS